MGILQTGGPTGIGNQSHAHHLDYRFRLSKPLQEGSPRRVFASLQELDLRHTCSGADWRTLHRTGVRTEHRRHRRGAAVSRFFLDAYRVPSSAMLPGWQMGEASSGVFKDCAMDCDRFSSGAGRRRAASQRRGDIVALVLSRTAKHNFSRALAVPMDTVESCGSTLRINGALARFRLQELASLKTT